MLACRRICLYRKNTMEAEAGASLNLSPGGEFPANMPDTYSAIVGDPDRRDYLCYKNKQEAING